MEFNFDKTDEELIKILFEKEEPNVIISGSYALYKIHYKNIKELNINKIEIKDLDIDLKELVERYNNIENNEELKKELKEIIEFKITNKFLKLKEFENINNFKFNVYWDKMQKRAFNFNTLGLGLEIIIWDNDDRKHIFDFNFNFENKNFKVLKKKIDIDNKIYNLYVYDINKTYSDKIISVIKRFEVLINKKNKTKDKFLEPMTKRDNFTKMNKDSFDLKVMQSNSNLDTKEILENIVKMIPLETKSIIKR